MFSINKNCSNTGLYQIWTAAPLLNLFIYSGFKLLEHIYQYSVFWLQHKNVKDGIWPTDSKPFFERSWLKREEAYDKAVEKILEDPRQNFCQITSVLKGYRFNLKCFTSNRQPTFSSGNGDHLLLYSKTCFKWKKNLRG